MYILIFGAFISFTYLVFAGHQSGRDFDQILELLQKEIK